MMGLENLILFFLDFEAWGVNSLSELFKTDFGHFSDRPLSDSLPVPSTDSLQGSWSPCKDSTYTAVYVGSSTPSS